MYRRGSSNVGGLSFADNSFEIASPNYEAYNQVTAVNNERWQAAKKGIESTADFIEGQSVMDVDKGIKSGAIDAFTKPIAQYVESGRYEDATFALDSAVRDFQKNKGFAAATANYATYSKWAQEQRNHIGWDENDKDNYIAKGINEYQGVQIKEDGTVTGSFNTRDMGEFINIQDKLFDKLKDFRPDVSEQVLKTISRGVLGDQRLDRVQGLTQVDSDKVIEFANNYINNDPEVKHFTETKRRIELNKSFGQVANGFESAIANSEISKQRFLYNRKESGNIGEFDNKYSTPSTAGKADYRTYTIYRHLAQAGLVQPEDARKPYQIVNEYQNTLAQFNAIARNTDQPIDANEIYNKVVSGESQEATDIIIAKAEQYRRSLATSNVEMYKADQAYNSVLPWSNVEQTIKLNTWTDSGIQFSIKQAAEKAANLLPIGVVNSSIKVPIVTADVEKDGLNGFKADIDLYEGMVNEGSADLLGHIKAFNEYINAVNSDEDPDNNIDASAIEVPETLNYGNILDIIDLTEKQELAFKQFNPANYKDFSAKGKDLYNNFRQYDRQNKLMDNALEYARVNDPNFKEMPTDAELVKEMYELNDWDYEADNEPKTIDAAITYRNEEWLRDSFTKYKKSKEQEFLTNSDMALNYVKDHMTNGISVPSVHFSGIYNATDKEGKSINNQIITMVNAVKGRVRDGNVKYTVIDKDGTHADNQGGEIIRQGWPSNTNLTDMRLESFYEDPGSGKIVYNFVGADSNAADGAIKNGLGEGIVNVQITDSNNELGEIITFLSKNEDSLPPEAATAINNIMGTQAYGDNINYSHMRHNLSVTNGTDVVFDIPNRGLERIGGVEKIYADKYTGGDDSKKDKTIKTLRYSYPVTIDGVTTTEVIDFDNFTQLSNHLNEKYKTLVGKFNK